jgi:hypothetical protein
METKKVFYLVISGSSELERFKTEEKANEVCEYYKSHGFPNAKVTKLEY